MLKRHPFPLYARRTGLRLRFIPFLVFVGFLSLAVRVHEVKLRFSLPEIGISASRASETAAKDEKEKNKEKEGEKEKESHASGSDAHGEKKPEPLKQAAPPSVPPDKASLEVLKTLTGRREELDRRARALDEREALIKVTEARMDQKMAELKALQSQLGAILDKLQQEQKNRLDSLVGIYEKMKPQEAAKILSAMDMPVLLDVMQAMKTQKVSLILAAMEPARAREITLALARRREISRMAESTPVAPPPAPAPAPAPPPGPPTSPSPAPTTVIPPNAAQMPAETHLPAKP